MNEKARYIIKYVGNDNSNNRLYSCPNQNIPNNGMQYQSNLLSNTLPEVQNLKCYHAVFNPEVVGVFDSLKVWYSFLNDDNVKFLIRKYMVLNTQAFNTMEECIAYLNKSFLEYYAPKVNWDVNKLRVPVISNLACNTPLCLNNILPNQNMINGQSCIGLK